MSNYAPVRGCMVLSASFLACFPAIFCALIEQDLSYEYIPPMIACFIDSATPATRNLSRSLSATIPVVAQDRSEQLVSCCCCTPVHIIVICSAALPLPQMSVSVQREWKRQQVVDCLTRIGGMVDPEVKKTFGTDETYGYRSKLTPHYDTPYKGRVREIGFQK